MGQESAFISGASFRTACSNPNVDKATFILYCVGPCRNIGMRNYKRKTQRKNLTDAQRKEIKEKVNNGESRRSLAGMYGVSEKTIRNYLKKVSLPFIY